ncbi:basic amino acid/polyamine antiporter, APA family [Streptomyces sp. Ncost-T6T-2b]|nr:basic amino acid/polyamine antiporter, APA family [Streptomyces sp. Ncost-T6T-2b]
MSTGLPRSGTPKPSGPHLSGLRRKSPEQLIAESGGDLEGHGLKRTMGLFQLVCFGVGAIVGTGIFVGLSDSVAEAGPAVVISFVLAAITCIFTALSFAELGSAIPVSGSSYSFAYAALGERTAFLVGWCLLLEYGVSVSAVAVGWSQYVNELLNSLFGWELPAALSAGPGDGGVVNLPAVVVIAMAATLLVRGVRESATATAAMAVLKIGILVAFCAVAFSAFQDDNLMPFATHGLGGITAGASLAFFSYIGFDAITTAGEEVKNPRRNIPIAILICIGVVTLLYCAVALSAIGAIGSDDVANKSAALSIAVNQVTDSSVGGGIIAFGAVVAIASVVLAVMYGQTRILMSMSRDGLIPRVFERVSPKTPHPGRQHLDRGLRLRGPGRLRLARRRREPDDHRHARHDGRRQCRGGGAPPPQPRAEADLPGPALPGQPAAGCRLLPVPDVRDRLDDLGPVRGLPGRRLAPLRRIRPQALPAGQLPGDGPGCAGIAGSVNQTALPCSVVR